MKTRIRASLLAIAVTCATTAAFAHDPTPAPAPMTPAAIDKHLDNPKHTDSSALPDSASQSDMAMPATPMHHHHHHHGHHHHHHHTMKTDMAPAAPADDTKGN